MSDNRSISLVEAVLCLASAIDLVNPAVANHHRRVSCLAGLIATETGMSDRLRLEVTVAGLLHDVGAFSLKERLDLLEFEMDHPFEHAEKGYLLLKTFSPLTRIARIVQHHHVPWDNGKGKMFRGQPVVPGSQILHLADRATVLINDNQPILSQIERISATIRQQSGDLFNPEVVEAFMSVAGRESTWLELTSSSLEQQLILSLEEYDPPLSLQTLNELSRLFSRIIDFRSSFTALHSSGVAAVAERIAQFQGLTSDERLMIKISGNLHDIGKLAVPKEIIEKRDQLSQNDQNIIRSHSYHTYQALTPMKRLGEIRIWSSFHHERPDGTGYPFHVKGDALDEGCRIVAIADIFTALTENRPYRPGMGRDAIRDELMEMAGRKHIDGQLMTLVSDCYEDLTGTCLGAKEKSLSEYLGFRGAFDMWSRQSRGDNTGCSGF